MSANIDQPDPIGFVFVHTDGSVHDFSITEHSSGMKAVYASDLVDLLTNELNQIANRFYGTGPLPSTTKCALDLSRSYKGCPS